MRQLTADYASRPVFQSEFSLQFIYPSLRLSLLHQGELLSHLFHKTEIAESLQNNPVLCPCIPAAYFSWESVQIHSHQVTSGFILNSLFSTHMLEWLKKNNYQLYRYEDTNTNTNTTLNIYMTQWQDKARQLVARYTIYEDTHSIYLMFLPFLSSLVVPPITPLLQLLERSLSRRSITRSIRSEASGEEDDGRITIIHYYERLQSELKLGYSLFYTLSELFNSVLMMRGVRHPSIQEEEEAEKGKEKKKMGGLREEVKNKNNKNDDDDDDDDDDEDDDDDDDREVDRSGFTPFTFSKPIVNRELYVQ